MKKWGMGVVALTTFLGVAGLCGTGCSKPTTAQWAARKCELRTGCNFGCPASSLSGAVQASGICASAAQAYRDCAGEDHLSCGTAGFENCGDWTEKVLIPCLCGDGVCDSHETSFNCPVDCSTS